VKIKLDVNLHTAVVEVLAGTGNDVDTVADPGLLGADDATVCQAAAAEGRLIITLDRGFGDVRTYPPGTHARILVLRPEDHSLLQVKATLERLVRDVTLD
jgi:predicted nuclease of predicted toxin-antitoxin system